MGYTRITVVCYLVVIISFLNGINCVGGENGPLAKTVQSRFGVEESSHGGATGRAINSNVAPLTVQSTLNAPPSTIESRRDGTIGSTKGRTVVFTVKKHPKIVLLREVRRPPPKLVARPIVHQRRGNQQTNVAALNQQAQQQNIRQQQAQQESFRQQQMQQQRFIENQAQQQAMLAQNAFQQQLQESQSLIDQRKRQEQQAQQERLRQQAFLDAVAEQERKSYLEKKRREQNRRRRFPDGLNHQERIRNEMVAREKQRELAHQQALLNGAPNQQGLFTQQQNNFQIQNSQLQSQQLRGAASQQHNWIYHPQALDNTNALQQLSEQEQRRLPLVQQQAFQKERERVQVFKKVPKLRKQLPLRLGRIVVLRLVD